MRIADPPIQVGETVDAAAFFFLSLDKTCHAQLLVDAAAQGSGHKKTFIGEEEARDSYEQVGLPSKGELVPCCEREVVLIIGPRLVELPAIL